jgi:hypothetical protein
VADHLNGIPSNFEDPYVNKANTGGSPKALSKQPPFAPSQHPQLNPSHSLRHPHYFNFEAAFQFPESLSSYAIQFANLAVILGGNLTPLNPRGKGTTPRPAKLGLAPRIVMNRQLDPFLSATIEFQVLTV